MGFKKPFEVSQEVYKFNSQFLFQQIFIDTHGVLRVKRKQTFLCYRKKLLLLFQSALNITIPTDTLVLLTKVIKN